MSKNKVVVTLHADTIPTNVTWMNELVKPLGNPEVATTCSMQKPPQYSQRSITLLEKMLWAKLKQHNALNDKADAYRKSILMEIGSFDGGTFRTAGEDEDISLRLKLYNKMIVVTKAEVIHDHYFNCRSNMCFLRKVLKKEFSFGRAGGVLRIIRKLLNQIDVPHPHHFSDGDLCLMFQKEGCGINYHQCERVRINSAISIIAKKLFSSRVEILVCHILPRTSRIFTNMFEGRSESAMLKQLQELER